MLMTPLGGIHIQFDDIDIDYEYISIDINERLFPDVGGAFRVIYHYRNDKKDHILKCYLDNENIESYVEDGENYSSIGIYYDITKMNIGVEGDFGYPYASYDYSGSYLKSGISIEILPNTISQEFVFGISWINIDDTEKDIQTWFASDPTLNNTL